MFSLLVLIGCPGPTETGDTDADIVEILDPEPAGAPTDVADGRLTCLGAPSPVAGSAGALELTGYVRTLADPEAASAPPAAQIDVFDPDGMAIGTTYANTSADGRVAVSVPVPAEGFTGWVVVTHADYVSWRFQNSRPITNSMASGWTWLVTPTERDALAADLGVTPGPGDGILAGAVHDCDGFGVANAIVVVDDDPAGVLYAEGFTITASRTYTATSGRFVMPVAASGPVIVKAFGRLEPGGPLLLLSSVATQVDAGFVSAVNLDPRTRN